MPLSLIILTALLTAAVTAAAYAFFANRQRRELLSRAGVGAGEVAGGTPLLIVEPSAGLASRIGSWLHRHAPTSWGDAGAAADKLVHAGFSGPSAPVAYATIRFSTAIALPLLAFIFGPRESLPKFLLTLGFALAVGLLGPPATLDRLAQRRQARIRRALPDALDLLVVCVEAGVSLDAAILRVAKEMAILHADLADEFAVVNRKVNAGIGRDAALHGLWTRTGVEELRGLASSMIQCEKWGTSISKVLRVYAETLRRKRKQAAEKRAAEASLKMLFPLVLFIFPTLFAVILGPAMISIRAMFLRH